MSDDAESACLVVIGASAGGVDALARLASVLPPNFATPIVVAQHADPKGPGRLAEILRRQSGLQIGMVDSNDDVLEPGHVYLAAPGRNLTIQDDRVYSTQRHQGHPVPSIDLLFTSAAHAFGDRVIAVVLTGMGTDGVAGVRAVKEAGGTVVVQEIGSAAYPALPAAIPTSYVDFTSTVEELPSLLATLAAPGDGTLAEGPALEAFLAQVRGRSGIDFRQYKMQTIRRRLARLMTAANCHSLADYLRYLNSDPDAHQRLVSAFLIKVTGFFRDPQLFRFLEEAVLPELIQDARDSHGQVRIWSAGCATGEEAYSLAILVAKLLGDDLERMSIRIFATDLDARAIDFARRGTYPAASLGDMPRELVDRYFTSIDGTYQVKKRIRNLTVFGEYDLGQRAPFPRIDLVVCRNVLIYFTKELQQRVLQLFAFSLRQRGYLALGKAETTSPLAQYFSPVNPTLKVYRRQGERLLLAAPAVVDGLRIPVGERSPKRRSSHGGEQPHTEDKMMPRWSLADRLGAFLFESDIGVVVVDRHYDIITINQSARGLLGIASQGIGNDLIHLAQIPAAELKGVLDAAFRGEMPSITLEVAVRDPGAEDERYLTLSCYPDRAASKDGRTEGVIVVVTDSTRTGKHRRFLEGEYEDSRAKIARLNQQNEELVERHRTLTQANAEISSANVELRNANEHLMISAEEAEASAEEIETLNEEMQATSEELETLNEELHATVEELNTTNEELAARTADLEAAVRERQEQIDSANATLETLHAGLGRLPLVVCFLDKEAIVTVASERYSQLAAKNRDALPAVGEEWRVRGERLALQEDGRPVEYRVDRIALAEKGPRAIVVLTPAKT